MLTADPRTIISGVEAVVILQTDHNNWSASTSLSLSGGATGDYIIVDSVDANAAQVRIKSNSTSSIVIMDQTNNEATSMLIRTPAQLKIEGRSLPEVIQAIPKSSPVKRTHK